MLGIIFSIIAGISMSLQGVFNTRLGEKIGLWETNAIVQGTGFALTLITLFLLGNGSLSNIKYCNKIYLLGGFLGVIITFTVMKGIASLGATYSIATILVAQLTAAALIDAFGFFGATQVKFHITKIIGICIMILGIIIFKWKG
ncbi:DMT family transporter [Clostridium scatologenes]|uniref:DMT family transporter n=1 Tax=Clostridium scatologenes TaxID=1548 RepID=A0A0E3GS20_CLOSL|nr:DMT family transporter [Clostridium scatologenes]AKA71306.1 protein of unknown function DUF606 [Clostridium scatologenes]